jgi:protein-disulfide isomerase
VVGEELAKTDALLAAGTKPTGLYDAVTRDGKGPPGFEELDMPERLPADGPARGPATAKVTIHEWGDFQCPYTKRVEATMRDLVKEYGPRVRLVWHDMPLSNHPRALIGAQAAREAYAQKGAAGFWAMHDKLLDGDQTLTRDQLDGYATELKLDMPLWTSALVGDAHVAAIEADHEGPGLSGTPAFLIVPAGATKGFKVLGAQGIRAFEVRIDKALSHAK